MSWEAAGSSTEPNESSKYRHLLKQILHDPELSVHLEPRNLTALLEKYGVIIPNEAQLINTQVQLEQRQLVRIGVCATHFWCGPPGGRVF